MRRDERGRGRSGGNGYKKGRLRGLQPAFGMGKSDAGLFDGDELDLENQVFSGERMIGVENDAAI